MKRYRFRLQSVLRVRRIQEEIARKDLAEATRAETRAKETVTHRIKHYAGVPHPPSGLDTDDFLARQARLMAAAAAVVAARANLQMASAVAAARRADWAQAETKVKSLERLDERDRDAHRAETLRQEQAEIDELASRPREDDR